MSLHGLFYSHPPSVVCPPSGFSFLSTKQCRATLGAIPGTGFQVSPLYGELYRRRGPLRWWRPWPTQSPLSACSRSPLCPETSRQPRVSLLCRQVPPVSLPSVAAHCASVCVSIQPVSSLSSSGRTAGIVMYSGDDAFRSVHRFQCSERWIIRERTSLTFSVFWANTCFDSRYVKCDSLGGIRSYGSLFWCLCRRNLDYLSFDFRMVSVFCLLGATVDTCHASVFGCFRFIFQSFSSCRWTSHVEVLVRCLGVASGVFTRQSVEALARQSLEVSTLKALSRVLPRWPRGYKAQPTSFDGGLGFCADFTVLPGTFNATDRWSLWWRTLPCRCCQQQTSLDRITTRAHLR